MSFWTAENLRTACGGVFTARPEWINQPAAPIEGVSTDSRAVSPGQVFFAIRGDTFDGHDFLANAAEAGAAILVIDRPDAKLPSANAGPTGRGVGVLKVADARKALGRLAHAYRKTLDRTKVIAVCGSNGKTTTVRIIDSVLSAKLRGTASKKSFNNDIGVPLTILSAKHNDQYLLCEVGTNAPGEIAALGKIVEPDIAVITSIGREHLEGLGSLEGVAREEFAIVASVRQGGVAVVTADSPELNAILGGGQPAYGPSVVRFGRGAGADLRLTACTQALDSSGAPETRFSVNARQEFMIPLAGEHNACNALSAVAVARRLGLDDKTIAAALGAIKGVEMRWQAHRVPLNTEHGSGHIDVINDAYNANPDSMIASLRTLAGLYPDRRRVFVMGDMFELGAASEAGHADVGRAAAQTGVGAMATFGETSRLAANEARACGVGEAQSYPEVNDASCALVRAMLKPGDAVLVKGSRRMKLERVVAALGGAEVKIAPINGGRSATRTH